MSLFSLMAEPADYSRHIFSILVDSGVRGIVLLTAAFLILLVFRRTTAAIKHLLLSTALVGMVLLPLLTAILPSWHLPIVPRDPPQLNARGANLDVFLKDGDVSAEPLLPVPGEKPIEKAAGGAHAYSDRTEAESVRVLFPTNTAHISNTPGNWTWRTWILLVWFSGVLLVLMPYAFGMAFLLFLPRGSRPADRALSRELDQDIRGFLHLKRKIRLLLCKGLHVPITFGLLRPAVLLPQESENWTAAIQRIVLLHEAGHI